MQLKTYQENTVNELLGKAKKLLKYSGKKKLVFKSPTGSGKTIMMAGDSKEKLLAEIEQLTTYAKDTK